jgi:curved DNA-binding protein CbpA
MSATRSYYDVLGVMPDASEQQIRQRFRELARRSHPDRFQGEEKARAEAEFQSITQAFNVLVDPLRRRDHDFELAQAGSGRTEKEGDRTLRAFLQRGRKAYREGKWAEAAAAFHSATEAAPGSASAWYHLALTCQRNPRWQAQAVEASRRACEIDTMNVDYLKLAGDVHRQAGFAAKAEKFYTDALHWGGPDAKIETAVQELMRAR